MQAMRGHQCRSREGWVKGYYQLQVSWDTSKFLERHNYWNRHRKKQNPNGPVIWGNLILRFYFYVISSPDMGRTHDQRSQPGIPEGTELVGPGGDGFIGEHWGTPSTPSPLRTQEKGRLSSCFYAGPGTKTRDMLPRNCRSMSLRSTQAKIPKRYWQRWKTEWQPFHTQVWEQGNDVRLHHLHTTWVRGPNQRSWQEKEGKGIQIGEEVRSTFISGRNDCIWRLFQDVYPQNA